MTDMDDLLKLLHDLDNLRSYAGWLSSSFDDFRRDTGLIVLGVLEEYDRRQGLPALPLLGVHGRNDLDFMAADFELIRESKVQTVKMMSQTRPRVFEILKGLDVQLIITRLYDDRFGTGHHPTPAEFRDRMVPVIQALQPYCTFYEIHNEPNHLAGYEGWGQTDADARDFDSWFVEVYRLLKAACPWAEFGFPGLAVPHRDIEWLNICRQSLRLADWLGCHTYWQNPTDQDINHLSGEWGLRCDQYHRVSPNKPIHITEAGNSNHQTEGLPHNDQKIALEIVEHARAVLRRPWIGSVAYFLMSSQDRTWADFAWRTEQGQFKPIVARMGELINSL